MTFAQSLNDAAADPRCRDNLLSDGTHSVAYHELNALLDEVHRALARQSVQRGDCLAVTSANSVAGAVFLLALIREGYSFVLTPPSVNADVKPIPAFCRFNVAIEYGSAPRPADQFLTIQPNPAWNGRSVPAGKLLLRTSGSIGASKIVVHDHAALIGNAANCVRKYGFEAESRCAIPVPIAHMYGFGAVFLPAVQVGASIELMHNTNAIAYLDRERRFQPTIAFVTPTICTMLMKVYKSPRTHYDVVVTSGQRIGEDLFLAFDEMVGGRLINQYGSTEMGATSACNPGDDAGLRSQTIGTPMADVQLRIADGEPGELMVLHPFGYDGYLSESGDWIARVEAGTWYSTGDLATQDAGGAIKILGRAGASVNRDGHLILLEDIERACEKLAGIAQIAVAAVPGFAARGERIAMFCVASDGDVLEPTNLRNRCIGLLPRYAMPDDIHVRDHLPMLASGKVDRRSLVASLSQREQ